jgi:hypothetical protein
MESAYCDTSFIIEYWQAFVEHEDGPYAELAAKNRPKYLDFVKGLLRSESRYEKLKPLRRKIDKGEIQVNFISSSLALSELYEKHAEWNFKLIVSDATSIDRTFSKGKKDIAELITKVYRDQTEEGKSVISALVPSHLEYETFGIEFKDIDCLSLQTKDFYSKYSLFSVLQIGSTDILHLLAASRLGAKYFLTFDNDFARVSREVSKYFEIEVRCGSDALDSYFRTLPCSKTSA